MSPLLFFSVALAVPPVAPSPVGAPPTPADPAASPTGPAVPERDPSSAEPPEGAHDTVLLGVEEASGSPNSPSYSLRMRSQEGVLTTTTVLDDGLDGDVAAGDHIASRRVALSGGLYGATLSTAEGETPLYRGNFAFTADDVEPRFVLRRSADGVSNTAAGPTSSVPVSNKPVSTNPANAAIGSTSSLPSWASSIVGGLGAFALGFGLMAAWGLVERRRRPVPLGSGPEPTCFGLPPLHGTTVWIVPAEASGRVVEALAVGLSVWGRVLVTTRPEHAATTVGAKTGHAFRLPTARPTAAAVTRACRDLGARTALIVEGAEAVEAPLPDESAAAVLEELITAKPVCLQIVLKEGEATPAGAARTVRLVREGDGLQTEDGVVVYTDRPTPGPPTG